MQVWDKTFEDDTWLSQANYIFSRLRITSKFEDYGVASLRLTSVSIDLLISIVHVQAIQFYIMVSASKENRLTGFLFLCPGNDLQTDASAFRWPDYPAYWSLDPSGAQCLSTEEATRLGFPSLRLNITVLGFHWDAGVYTGLRQFHRGKGFDPESQDVARHLGYPLCEFTTEGGPPFTHGELVIVKQCSLRLITLTSG